MDADEIVEVVCEELQRLLASGSESRTYKVQVCRSFNFTFAGLTRCSQTLLPGVKKVVDAAPTTAPTSTAARTQSKTKVAPNKLVRTDATTRTLDSMFGHASPVMTVDANADDAGDESRPSKRRKKDNEVTFEKLLASEPTGKNYKLAQSDCLLGSVQELRKEVVEKSHSGSSLVFSRKSYWLTDELLQCSIRSSRIISLSASQISILHCR